MQDLLWKRQSVTSGLENGQVAGEEVNEACEGAQQIEEGRVVIR